MNQVKIKVIGIGGGSGTAINHIVNEKIMDVDFIVANTDKQALDNLSGPNRIQLGINTAYGESTDMNLGKGSEAATESYEEIKTVLSGADITLMIVALGGGTGTGSAPIIARIIQETGALLIPIVTIPFSWEGRKRRNIAQDGLEELAAEYSSVIVIPVDKLNTTGLLSIKECFKLVDIIIIQVANSIIKSIPPYQINDSIHKLSDIKTIMSYKGIAHVGIGQAKSSNAIYDALMQAIKSPLLDNVSINDAKGLLIHFDISSDNSNKEMNDVMNRIEKYINKDALVIFGITENNKMDIQEVKVTIIATGFNNNEDYDIQRIQQIVLSS